MVLLSKAIGQAGQDAAVPAYGAECACWDGKQAVRMQELFGAEWHRKEIAARRAVCGPNPASIAHGLGQSLGKFAGACLKRVDHTRGAFGFHRKKMVREL